MGETARGQTLSDPATFVQQLVVGEHPEYPPCRLVGWHSLGR